MKPQSRDSYQPRDSGVHSNKWMRGADGSIVYGRDDGGEVDERSVIIVCSGREGSQESI